MRGRNNGGGGGGNNNNNNNNNNRKGPNPLTRNYESNGPDVKIRGSAQQIAEKYTTLARDAMSSGDRVVAENYLQHAEHYNRIIAAAQAQMPIQQAQNNRDDMDEDGDDDQFGYEGGQGGNAQNNGGANGHGDSQNYGSQQSSQPAAGGTGPQPVIEGTPAEVALNPEASGQGGRHRDRRPNPPQPEVRAEAGEQPAIPAGDDQGAPRRGRRPRRDRNRGDFTAAGDGEASSEPQPEAGAQAPQSAPATETPDGKAALAAFGD